MAPALIFWLPVTTLPWMVELTAAIEEGWLGRRPRHRHRVYFAPIVTDSIRGSPVLSAFPARRLHVFAEIRGQPRKRAGVRTRKIWPIGVDTCWFTSRHLPAIREP